MTSEVQLTLGPNPAPARQPDRRSLDPDHINIDCMWDETQLADFSSQQQTFAIYNKSSSHKTLLLKLLYQVRKIKNIHSRETFHLDRFSTRQLISFCMEINLTSIIYVYATLQL